MRLSKTQARAGGAWVSLAILAGGLVLTVVSRARADVPDYKIGDTAKENVTAPIRMVVVDQAETSNLRSKEAAREPGIWRYFTNNLAEAEAVFRGAYAQAHTNLLDHVQAGFARRVLDAQTAASPAFERLFARFGDQLGSFPVSMSLAQAWARGDSDEQLQGVFLGALRAAMGQPVRPDGSLPNGARGSSVVLRVVPLASRNQTLTLDLATRRGMSLSRTDTLTFTQARQRLLSRLPAEGQPAARFMVSLLRTNCVLDDALTSEARVRRTELVWSADRYEAGQLIVRQGQRVDRKIKAALDQLREKTAVAALAQKLQEEASKPPPPPQPKQWNPYLVAGAGGLVAVLAMVVWRMVRPRRSTSLLPARIAGSGTGATIVSCPSCAENIVVATPVPNAAADLRASVAPHLARLLMDKLVGKLISQRSSLVNTQEKAAAEMAELEARLEKMHAPLQERLRAYEQRIIELERELAQKGEENRELIKLKIALARNHLATTKDKLDLN